MRNILKIELKRAFFNKLFVAALIIGCVISCLHVVQNVLPMAKSNIKFPATDMPPHSVFNNWIGSGFNFWSGLFFAIFPILAAIPFADSFFLDCKTGYVKNIFTRTEKKHYYVAKAIAVFLSGGVAVILPLLLNLYLTAMILPSIAPDIAVGTYPLFAQSTWASIFYTNAYLYIFMYLILIFITSGLFATVALGFSFLVKYSYVVLLTPFLCFITISFISLLTSISDLDVMLWITPNQPVPANFMAIIPTLLILFAFLVIGFYVRGIHTEPLNEK